MVWYGPNGPGYRRMGKGEMRFNTIHHWSITKKMQWVLMIWLCGLALPGLWASPAQARDVVVRSVVGDFDRVWEELEDTIKGKGLVISSTSYIKRMLENTGDAFGYEKKLYVDAKVLGFCSATLARQMFEADRHFMIFCPFKIAAYAIPSEADRVYLSYWPLKEKDSKGLEAKVLGEVDKLLADVIDQTIKTFQAYN